VTAVELLKKLRALDVRVWLQDDRVRVSAPAGVLTPELQRELSARKEDLRVLLMSFRAESAATGEREPAPVETAAEGAYPASSAQRRLWFVDHLDNGNIAYNIGASRQLREEIDPDAMRRALDALVRRQGALRTVFREDHGEIIQWVKPFEPQTLEVVDLSTLPQEALIGEAARLSEAEAKAPFDLAQGPLYRVKLVKLRPNHFLLLFTLHHIISDGWSLGIFVEELEQLYRAYAEGREPLIAPLPLQYGEYAQSEQRRLQGAELNRLLDYWRTRLSGAPQLLELPTDRPRPPRQTFKGDSFRFELSVELSEALRLFARREQATLYMALFSAFAVLLHRYSGQDDIVIGTPLANRETPELERLIGLFVSTLAIRSQFSDEITPRQLLAQVKENVLGGQAHQDLPFDKLVEVLKPERSMAWSPIFQVTFALQNTPLASAFDVTTSAAMYDLCLFCWDEPTGIRCVVEYSTDLFDRATIERMSKHLQCLFKAFVDHPDTPVARLPMLDAAEREIVVTHWNATTTPYERDASLPELFARAVQRHANSVAVQNVDPSQEIFGRSQLTYAELDRAVAHLATYLRQHGIAEGECVGLYMGRSIAAIVSILAILKVGAAYVPLDVASPPARTAEILADAGIKLVVSQRSLMRQLPQKLVKAIALDAEWSKIERTQPLASSAEIQPQALAYVMFTSGTTGKPKGVCVTHRNVVRLVRNTNYVSADNADVVLQFAPLAFDASTFEIWAALLHGARLVVHPQSVPTASELARVLTEHRVSVLWLTSGFFHYMIENELEAVARVKQVLAGGDVLSPTHVQKLLDAKHDGVVVNGYGPTENTTFTCCHTMKAGERLNGNVPIGRPIANTRVYILDAAGDPAPIGVPGELYAAGDGVALGYLRDETRTAERFVPDKFAAEPGAMMYRTGDVARWRNDGLIEFMGRRDRQVKIRGFRIELEEVENALRACARVHDATVVTKRDASGTNVLVAYLVPRAGTAIDQAEIRRDLVQRVPDYMIPAAFVMLDALPLTANGKLDRAALPDAVLERSEIVPPRTIVETQLLTIWENIFGRAGFGVRDNFFDLGGHSLLAVRMFAQVEQAFGRRLPTSALFQAPTIEQLARRLTDEGFQSPWQSLVAIQPRGERPPLFLVPGMGGNVVGYVDLARLLGSDRPFYGLQARGLDGKEAPFERIEEMAAHYISEIRRVQPRGPYYLGGACFGGVVAYEMAQQLHAAGEEVAFLMLLETWPPPMKRRALFFKELSRKSPPEAWKGLVQRLQIIKEMIARRDIYRGDAAAMYVDRVSTANHTAFLRYRPRRYDGSLLLVLASARQIRTPRDPRLVWGSLARSFTKVDVPALDSGLALKSPHVEMLAKAMKEALDKVEIERAQREAGRIATERPLAASA
jgi:amino acid adenylation domain-containing protein